VGRLPDNVVLNRAAAAAQRAEFLGWQCRIRQLAARTEGGRPSPGMRPRVLSGDGTELARGIITLIIESDPEDSTQLFRYQYLRTQDPNERYDSMLEVLQGSYFQEPARFTDVMTALFAADSPLAAELAGQRCALEFEQYSQGYRIACEVTRLPEAHRLHQATLWHNRMFNPALPSGAQVLAFTPDWPHSASYRAP
jgi:hypothetical protein